MCVTEYKEHHQKISYVIYFMYKQNILYKLYNLFNMLTQKGITTEEIQKKYVN